MSAKAQLALNLEFRPALARDDFLVAETNAEAVAWIDRAALDAGGWSDGRLAIFGPAGSGKTHLAQVWRVESGAVEISPDDILVQEPGRLLEGVGALILEDAERLAADGAIGAEALLHFLNDARERGCRVLLTGREPPARWPCPLPDLRSRLAAVQAVALRPPDEDLLAVVMVKLFADRRLDVAPEVIGYLVPRLERSFAAVQRIVRLLDLAALSRRQTITVPLARRVLREDEEGTAQSH